MGCDIGGTFTDFVLFNESTGEIHLEKCLTTSDDPSIGVIQGVHSLRARVGDFLKDTQQILHGTTLVINAVLERKGAKTAFVATEGFRDILEIGTERRYDLYDLQQQYPAPLVGRDLRIGIPERVRADGKVLIGLDEEQLVEIASKLAEQKVESVAICLLHSYCNPRHEERARDYLRMALPQVSISISSEVLPEINEQARSSTTVVNAYTKPLMEHYLSKLLEQLRVQGLQGQLLIMLSSGGVTSVETAAQYPVRVIESGPVGGVILSHHLKNLCGVDQALSFDMGGTTAKVCMLRGSEISRSSYYEVARVHRFKAGSGIPIKVPCVDVLEIGSGGGSIAHFDQLGLLQVGPESAASDPGPACYGRGGRKPTVTDADLILGYLNPVFFLGGAMSLDLAASRAAMAEHVAHRLNVDVTEAAWRVHDFVNENMAAATKMDAAERGVDLSAMTLIASGGAGPVHCFGLAKKLGIRKIIVPVAAGVASAVGFLVAPVSYDLVRTYKTRLTDADLAVFDRLFSAMEQDGIEVMLKAGESRRPTFQRSLDVRYVGQGHEINVMLPAEPLAQVGKQALLELFKSNYENVIGRAFEHNEFEVINLRLIAKGPEPAIPVHRPAGSKGRALKGLRPAYSASLGKYVDHQVYDRYSLSCREPVQGPAIIEERESTLIIGSEGMVHMDSHGLLHVSIT